MNVNFNLVKNNHSWNSTIHQLNSDVLTRHVLMKGDVDNVDISFSYCEKTCKGKIQIMRLSVIFLSLFNTLRVLK